MKFLLVLCVAVAAQATFIPNARMNERWENFKAKYGKTYGAMEESVRRQNYEENMAFIAQHNKEYAAGLHSYTVGENQLADLSYAERKALNGARAPLRSSAPKYHAKSSAPMAAIVDLRSDPCLQPIKDQGQCGSCWAFSAIGVLEFESCKATGNAVALSEQNLVDCSRGHYGNAGCGGGWYQAAYDYVIDSNGVDTEASYPYTASNGHCAFDPANIGATMQSYADVADAAAMVELLNGGHILNVAIDAAQSGFSYYSSGVYDDPACTTNTDHAVIVVGYGVDDASAKDYWIVRNSWGTSWGQDGYILIRRGVNMCAIEDWAMTVVA